MLESNEPSRIYGLLKKKIIWLDLAPESVLNLSDLASELGVSRTPIKESLILLQAEGWVVRQGSHFAVTPLSLNRIREVTEIRGVMELQANLWAFLRINPKELSELKEIKRQMQSINPGATNKELIELDFRFHSLIFKAAKNDTLGQMLEGLLHHYLRFWLTIVGEIDSGLFFKDALEIITGIEEKNEILVKTASASHIEWSVNQIRASF